jgi:hypothetical protein
MNTLLALLGFVAIGMVVTTVFAFGMLARNEVTAIRNGKIAAICLAVTGIAAIVFMILTSSAL